METENVPQIVEAEWSTAIMSGCLADGTAVLLCRASTLADPPVYTVLTVDELVLFVK